MERKILSLILLGFIAPPFTHLASGDPVADAYRSIPHSQTSYRSSSSLLEPVEGKAAESLLRLTDRALVERVLALQSIESDGKDGESAEQFTGHIDEILQEIDSLNIPPRLDGPRKELASAIRDQRVFLVAGYDQKPGGKIRSQIAADPHVLSAHAKLISVYNQLMALYPTESSENKRAFFDHLCALDFI